MPNQSNAAYMLLKLIKREVQNVFKTMKPATVLFGTVTKESPLEVTVDQKRVITSEFLCLCRGVTEYQIEETVDMMTEKYQGGSHDPSFQAHDHQITNRWPFILHTSLKLGEKVALIQQSGGQKFLIIDRVVDA